MKILHTHRCTAQKTIIGLYAGHVYRFSSANGNWWLLMRDGTIHEYSCGYCQQEGYYTGGLNDRLITRALEVSWDEIMADPATAILQAAL